MKEYSISTTESFEFGWRKFKEKGILFTGLVAIMAVLSSIQQTPQFSHSNTFIGISEIYFPVITVIGMLMSTYFSLGIWKIMIMHSRGEEIDLSNLFTISFRNFIHYILAYLLSAIATVLGLVFFIVPGIHIALRLMFLAAFIVDKDQIFDEALKSSWKLTQGSTVKLFVWCVLATAIVIIGFLSLFVGVFVALPMVSLALAFIYLKLTDQEVA